MKVRSVAVLLFITATIVSVHSSNEQLQAAQNVTREKIDRWVFEQTQVQNQAEFLVVLADQADLSGAASLKTKREKGRFVYDALFNKAEETQKPLRAWLGANGIEHHAYYLVNMILVKGDLNLALNLAARLEVGHVEGNPQIHNDVERPSSAQSQSAYEVQSIEGNIANTRAPEVWALGYRGQGVVVGGADTGYRWDHTTLKPQYRGWNGLAANHDFNWHDSVHSGGGSCGANSAAPCDDNGHGTHTVGTAVGDDGGTNQIGMAPGAKWIGCRNMNQGNGTPASYIECMEFFLAPYPVNGTPQQGDPDQAPDITTNSWSCPPSEGCAGDTLQQAVEAQRAAGIAMVVAAGNDGPSCSTVAEPPSLYDASYSVGAYSHTTNTIASFSSRGPVTIDGSNRLKPDISAPGVSIRSASNSGTSAFNTISGTSMATPHLAGAIALLWSAQPALRNAVSFTEQILNTAAVHVSSTSCSSSGVPNNTYGYGRLDIKAAVDAALPCTSLPELSRSSDLVPAGGGANSIDVISVSGCGWVAQSNASWINITSGASGAGNGTVNYSVTANPGAARSGTMVIAGQTFTVTQSAANATAGLYDQAHAAFFLRNSNTGGIADITFTYGPAGMGFTPLVGDWDGDGVDTIGLYNPATAAFFLRNSNTGGIADITVTYGPAGMGLIPIVGDWNGDGVDTIGLYNPAGAAFFLRNSNTGGIADFTFTYGPAGMGLVPVVGDWNGDGVDTVGLHNPAGAAFFLRNSNTGGIADITFTYGPAGMGFIALVGDWNGDGVGTIGLYNPAGAAFFLRNSNTGGIAEITFTYGPAGLGWIPIVGDWDGL